MYNQVFSLNIVLFEIFLSRTSQECNSSWRKYPGIQAKILKPLSEFQKNKCSKNAKISKILVTFSKRDSNVNF